MGLVATCVVGLAMFVASPAFADPSPSRSPSPAPAPSLSLSWRAPTACPNASDVHARIARRLDPTTSSTSIDLDIAVDVTAVGVGRTAGYRARIHLSEGTRTLSAARCTDLADAVAVIVARLVHDAQRARANQPRSIEALDNIPAFATTPNEVPHLPSAPPAVESGDITPGTHPDAWGGGVRLLALSGIGITTKVDYGGELAGYVRRHELYAEVGYARWAAQPTVVQSDIAAVDIGVSMLALRGGWVSRRMPLRAWLGLELGSMRGDGAGISDPRSGRWTAIASGFGVGWPMSAHAYLVGTFEVAASLERTRFMLLDGNEIYQPSPASARCALGLEVTWR